MLFVFTVVPSTLFASGSSNVPLPFTSTYNHAVAQFSRELHITEVVDRTAETDDDQRRLAEAARVDRVDHRLEVDGRFGACDAWIHGWVSRKVAIGNIGLVRVVADHAYREILIAVAAVQAEPRYHGVAVRPPVVADLALADVHYRAARIDASIAVDASAGANVKFAAALRTGTLTNVVEVAVTVGGGQAYAGSTSLQTGRPSKATRPRNTGATNLMAAPSV